MSNAIKKPEGAKIAVWFDRPRDCLCFANKLDERIKEGEAIPDECIIRIPLVDGEDFVEAIINSAYKTTLEDDSDFWKIMDGIQKLLDMRMATAIALSERLRNEWAKRSGGVVNSASCSATIRADEFVKLSGLRVKVLGVLDDLKRKRDNPESLLRELGDFVERFKLDESRDLPHPEGESPRSEEKPDRPGAGGACGGSDDGPCFEK